MVLAFFEDVKLGVRQSLQCWRVRLLVAAIVAALVTPPDPFTMLVVMVPLFALGELVAFFVRFSRPARAVPNGSEEERDRRG